MKKRRMKQIMKIKIVEKKYGLQNIEIITKKLIMKYHQILKP